MAFTWDNLITAVSTLVAGLGGAGLKERSDRKDRDAEAIREDAAARAVQEQPDGITNDTALPVISAGPRRRPFQTIRRGSWPSWWEQWGNIRPGIGDGGR